MKNFLGLAITVLTSVVVTTLWLGLIRNIGPLQRFAGLSSSPGVVPQFKSIVPQGLADRFSNPAA